MEALEGLLSRRSIRRYARRDVPEKVIETLLEAAMSAPSAGNGQPWHFIVIRDHRILNDIPKFHPYASMMRETPLGILVCGDLRRENKGFWVQDCSAASENLLLAAHAKGLGAVWLGAYPLEERISGFRNLVGLPEEIMPFALIAVGYPAEEIPHRVSRFDVTKVHAERW